MAAIPDAGGARSAPRVVWRALRRVVLLSGLVAVSWLLGSGISHADDDSGLPGTGLIPVVNALSSDDGASDDGASDDGSGDGLGMPAAVVPTVTKVLSTAPVPLQPPVQVSILRPVVQAIGIAKPPDQVLPVSRPLSVPTQHTTSARAGKPVTVPAAAPTVAGKAAAPAPALTPVVHAAPAVVCSPTQAAAAPVTIQPALGDRALGDRALGDRALGDGPASPMPASPPGSATSICAIGAGAGGAGGKNGPDAAVHDGWVAEGLAQPYGLLDRDTSGLPRSLSLQPSTSPD